MGEATLDFISGGWSYSGDFFSGGIFASLLFAGGKKKQQRIKIRMDSFKMALAFLLVQNFTKDTITRYNLWFKRYFKSSTY